MINVSVLFFGATAEVVGERQMEIDLQQPTNARQAFAEIVETFPQLKSHSLLFAVNQEYARGDEAINAGDELAVFTAVSGG